VFKTFLYGFLAGVIVTGIGWYSFGRINTSDLFRTIDRVDRDMEELEHSVSIFRGSLDRYAGKVAILNQESGGLWEQADSLRERSSEHVREYEAIQSELQFFGDGIASVEESVRRSVAISRDFADLLYEYRRRGEADGATN